ncbi:MAG TPA: SDR family oxidoreductase, partial [Bryobacteraceae bacterium]|nr:SDR family oxidoreductase [Bryobacteraceae bacterium]
MNITLTGRAAIVTGAARGIGLAIAQKLAGAGAAVVLTDVDAQALDHARAQIEKSVSGTATTIAGDLTGVDFPQAVVDKALDTFGSIDILVNNAGYTWDNVIQKTSDAQFQAMLDIHVIAPFRMLRAAASWLREAAKKEAVSQQGITRKVVNITSISGTDGNAGQVGYSAGKAAVVGLTKTMAKEWGRYQVTVNAVGFGLIDTRLTRPMEDPDTKIAIGERQVHVGMQAQIR